MRCPLCSTEDTRVIDSRPAEEGTAIRRRRECTVCGERFTTFERSAQGATVIKRNGSREPFDRAKMRRGLEAALADRPVTFGDHQRHRLEDRSHRTRRIRPRDE